MKRTIIIVLMALVLAVPVGYALANQSIPAMDTHLEQAAQDIGMTLEQARELMETARELRVRSHAYRQGISYEQALERMEQRRDRMQQRRQRNPEGHCQDCPRFSPPAE